MIIRTAVLLTITIVFMLLLFVSIYVLKNVACVTVLAGLMITTFISTIISHKDNL